jgi:hypothetical protein
MTVAEIYNLRLIVKNVAMGSFIVFTDSSLEILLVSLTGRKKLTSPQDRTNVSLLPKPQPGRARLLRPTL